MNRALGAVLCLGSVAAVGVSALPAQAETQHRGCRVAAAKPYVAADGKIRAAGSRAGCADDARFRIRILQSRPGPDRVVKSGSKVVRNARVNASLTCVDGTYYSFVTDYRGHWSRSRPVRLDCDLPTATPAPSASTPTSPATSPAASPAASPARPPVTNPTPIPTLTAAPGASPTGGSTVGTAIENEVVRLTNIERAKAGCGPLKHDARLNAAAHAHSANMSAQATMAHVLDGRDPGYRITAAGYRWQSYGENVAAGYRTPQDVVQGWMNSEGHRKNILNCSYIDIGAGYAEAGRYWTQVFGRQW